MVKTDPSGTGSDVVILASDYAKPEITSPLGPNNSITLPDAHVTTGSTPTDLEALAIANAAAAPADGLDVGVAQVTGEAYAAGTIVALPAGNTDSTDLTIGLDNTSAGAKSGTVALSYVSDGSVSGNPETLTGATLAITGNVYRYANPVITAPTNVIVHVGDGGGSYNEALTVANADPADGYSEGLRAAALGVASGPLSTATGNTGDLTAGSSDSNSLTVTVSTAAAANISGTVAVAETSDGIGVDTLGLTSLGTVDVPVNVTIDNYATAAFEQTGGAGTLTQSGTIYTLDLGTIVAGQTNVTAALGLFNTASGPADLISGALTANGVTAFVNAGTGNFSAVGAGSDAPLDIGLFATTAGIYDETLSFAGADGNASGFSEALPGETLVVTGTVVPAAQPVLNTTTPINFGNVHQDTTQQQTLSISNAAPAGSAFLEASVIGTTGAATGFGSTPLLAPGATDDTDLLVGLNTGAAGVQSGNVIVGYTSYVAPGSSPIPDASRVVDTEGTVYRLAIPDFYDVGSCCLSPRRRRRIRATRYRKRRTGRWLFGAATCGCRQRQRRPVRRRRGSLR